MSATTPNPMSYPASGSADVAMRRVSWGAIFVGAVLASALMVLFSIMGLAIGFGVVDPATESDPLAGLATGSAIYFIVTQLISLGAGGFAAARLSGVPRAMTAVLHGASVWAVTTLFAAWVAITGAGMLVGAGANAVTALINTTSSAVEAVIPDNLAFPDIPDLAASISIEDLPQPLQRTLRDNDITIAQLQTELTTAFRQVISTEEQSRAMELLRSTAMDAIRSPGDISADVNAALDTLLGGEEAILSAEDQEEVMTVLETRLGLTPAEVEQIFQTVEARIDTAMAELRTAVDTAQAEAVELAQSSAEAVSAAAFWLTLASVLGLLVAAGAGFAGRPDDLIGDRFSDRM